MPAKARGTRSAAPSASPAPKSTRSRSTRSDKTTTTTTDSDNDGSEGSGVPTVSEDEQGENEAEAEAEGEAEGEVENGDELDVEVPGGPDAGAEVEENVGGKSSMSDRMAKMKELRNRMNQSTAANRRDLIADHQKSKVTAKELARLEKQKKLAQTLRLKAEAEEDGVDLERKKNWEWSIEENERWQKKMDEQKEKGDNTFHNGEDDAFKKYNRHLKSTKPDLLNYERAKEAALGLAPGTLVPLGSTSQSLAVAGPSNKGLTASEDLYRGADTLSYGDNKPSEDAIDRLTGSLNKDMGKKKRKEKDDSDEPVTYINERNKVFNKKVARYYDKYTTEIRASFERGTAL